MQELSARINKIKALSPVIYSGWIDVGLSELIGKFRSNWIDYDEFLKLRLAIAKLAPSAIAVSKEWDEETSWDRTS